MILVKQAQIAEINRHLTYVYASMKLDNFLSLTDANKFLEDYFCPILNLTKKLNLINMNTCIDMNYPGIDLGDSLSKIAYQVTSNKTRKKICSCIEKFENNFLYKDFKVLNVFLIELEVPKYKGPFITNGIYQFNPIQNIISLKEIIREFYTLDEHVLKDIIEISNSKIEPLTKKLTIESIEMTLFKSLFELISDESAETDTGVVFEYDTDDLSIKSVRFKDYWNLIIKIYAEFIDTKREHKYKTILDSFSDLERMRVEEYLKYQSILYLQKNSDDPIKALEDLTKVMIERFGGSLISEMEITYFLYYQLYNCNVFPNPRIKNES